MLKTCSKCGGTIPAQAGPGGRRKMCPTCSPKRDRRKPAASGLPIPHPGGGESVADAVRALLGSRKGAADHPLGRLAVALAVRCDNPSETTAAVATAGKQLQAALAAALEASEPLEPDRLSELRARRRQRVAALDPVAAFHAAGQERES